MSWILKAFFIFNNVHVTSAPRLHIHAYYLKLYFDIKLHVVFSYYINAVRVLSLFLCLSLSVCDQFHYNSSSLCGYVAFPSCPYISSFESFMLYYNFWNQWHWQNESAIKEIVINVPELRTSENCKLKPIIVPLQRSLFRGIRMQWLLC